MSRGKTFGTGREIGRMLGKPSSCTRLRVRKNLMRLTSHLAGEVGSLSQGRIWLKRLAKPSSAALLEFLVVSLHDRGQW
jgi:hypothetical protein